MDCQTIVNVDCDFVINLKNEHKDKIEVISLYWRLPSQDMTEWILHIARFSEARKCYIGGIIVNGISVSWNVPLPQPNDKQVAISVSNSDELYTTSYDNMYARINEIKENLM
jgi:hypothetical protein